MKENLEAVRQWAQEKIQTGQEPPWAWYQLMKLTEACDAVLAGMAAVSSTESSQQSDERSGTRLRLVDATYPQDTAQPHPAGLPVQLPT